MTTLSLLPQSFSNEEVESGIETLNHELENFSKNHAQESYLADLPKALFHIKVIEMIKSRTQKEIDRIKSLLQVSSLVVSTSEKEQSAKDEKRKLEIAMTDKTVHLSTVQRKHDAIHLDAFKQKYGRFLNPFASVFGLGDALIAYTPLLAVYPKHMAIVAAAAIGLMIALSHIAYTPWIMKAESMKSKILRSVVVLVLALVFFYAISNIRAAAINEAAPAFGVNGDIVSTVVTTQINGWAICLISFGLFSVIFFLSLILWKSPKERQDAAQKNELALEIATTKKEIEDLRVKMINQDREVFEAKSFARMVHDYAVSCINRCRSIGENAINLFKNEYIRYHKSVPEYFIESSYLALDEHLNHHPKNDKP